MMAYQSGYQCDGESALCLPFSAVCNNSIECPQGDDEINCIPDDDTLEIGQFCSNLYAKLLQNSLFTLTSLNIV